MTIFCLYSWTNCILTDFLDANIPFSQGSRSKHTLIDLLYARHCARHSSCMQTEENRQKQRDTLGGYSLSVDFVQGDDCRSDEKLFQETLKGFEGRVSALWYTGLSCLFNAGIPCGCWLNSWLFHFQSRFLPMFLGKEWKMVQVYRPLWVDISVWETPKKLLPLASTFPSPGCCGHLKEGTSGWMISFLSHSVILPFK